MVEEIYKLKNDILEQVKKEIRERGIENVNVERMDKMINMVHHLAESEQACWEAQYYRNVVTEAMENKYGYSGGQQARQGYNQPMRQGYGSMGHGNIIDQLSDEYRSLSPDEQMKMKSQVFNMFGSR